MSIQQAAKEDYATQIKALLPPGPAWNRAPDSQLSKTIDAVAEQFTRVHNSANNLAYEMNPLFSFELLPDWENSTGLPDTCTGSNTTLQERRNAVLEKLNRHGGQSIAYFTQVCEGLGYELEIDEFRPFVCGVGGCGDELSGPPEVRLYWRVSVPGPRVTYLRCGQSQCGDYFGKISRAEDLECTLGKLKPAHTFLIFSYEGSA